MTTSIATANENAPDNTYEDEWDCDFCGSTEHYEVAHEDDSGREMTMNICSGCHQDV